MTMSVTLHRPPDLSPSPVWPPASRRCDEHPKLSKSIPPSPLMTIRKREGVRQLADRHIPKGTFLLLPVRDHSDRAVGDCAAKRKQLWTLTAAALASNLVSLPGRGEFVVARAQQPFVDVEAQVEEEAAAVRRVAGAGRAAAGGRAGVLVLPAAVRLPRLQPAQLGQVGAAPQNLRLRQHDHRRPTLLKRTIKSTSGCYLRHNTLRPIIFWMVSKYWGKIKGRGGPVFQNQVENDREQFPISFSKLGSDPLLTQNTVARRMQNSSRVKSLHDRDIPWLHNLHLAAESKGRPDKTDSIFCSCMT